MKEKRSNGLDARKFRYVLFAILLVLIAVGSSGFTFLTSQLREYAAETARLRQESSASSTRVSYLKSMREYLDSHKEDTARAKSIVTDSAKYKYQDQFIREILSFARKSGVNVTDFNFTTNNNPAGSPPAQAGQTPSTPGANASPGATASPAAPSGFSPTTVNVKIDTPVNYRNLLRFMRYIENNITKMQISSVGLSVGESGGRDSVTTNAFDIEVYLRS